MSENTIAFHTQAIGKIGQWGYVLVTYEGEHFGISKEDLKKEILSHGIIVDNIEINDTGNIVYHENKFETKNTYSFLEYDTLDKYTDLYCKKMTIKPLSVRVAVNDKGLRDMIDRATVLGYPTFNLNNVKSLFMSHAIVMESPYKIILLKPKDIHNSIPNTLEDRKISEFDITGFDMTYIDSLNSLFSESIFTGDNIELKFPDTCNVMDISNLFAFVKAKETTIDITSMNLTGIVKAFHAFGVSEIREVKLSQIGDKSNIEKIDTMNMFFNTKMDRLIISKNNPCYSSNVTNMFLQAEIKELDISGLILADKAKLTHVFTAFKGTLINQENTDKRLVKAYKRNIAEQKKLRK